jgi:uncharacterized protein (TIGR02246 family)
VAPSTYRHGRSDSRLAQPHRLRCFQLTLEKIETKAGRSVDPTYIARKLAASFVTAWNRHDMEELAGLFHEDAAFVNARGGYMLGREEILRQHAAIHAGPYRKTVLRAEIIDARELTPRAILAHLRGMLDGDERTPGQTRYAIMTLVIEQRAGCWLFIAAHNTNVAPGLQRASESHCDD